jgi:hypothetical protein
VAAYGFRAFVEKDISMTDSFPSLFSDDELDAVLNQDRAEKIQAPVQSGYPESFLEHFHPNIVDRLLILWGYPEFHNLLDSLMIDTRGDRQGFRKEVLDELMFLHTIHPVKKQNSTWENVNVKRNF